MFKLQKPILTTKLHIPSNRPKGVNRSRLIERLNVGLDRKLTLISAPAGFGKTTLVTEWVDNLGLNAINESQTENRVAWLSLDEGDNDLTHFLSYFIAALNQVKELDITFGKEALIMLQSPKLPPSGEILTSLINEFTKITEKYFFVLDDYHQIDSQPIHDALSFLLEHLPSKLQLVIITREDPPLPLARFRSQDQLTELRATDLRFTTSEAAEFLNRTMRLNLTAEDISALESRTEGWIAGLQLAGISLQGQTDVTSLIKSFTGSHRLVLDYLIEEVLNQQTEEIKYFLLQTSVLDRFTGSLCDAITGHSNGQKNLEYFEQINLFIVPLDNERQWYRYHHLFADLLRQQHQKSSNLSIEDYKNRIKELHLLASKWFETNGMEIEAFKHSIVSNNLDRSVRLLLGDGMPLHYRGEISLVLNWLESLPKKVMDSKPLLWVTYASVLMFVGQNTSVEKKLLAAEVALQSDNQDNINLDLVGQIAAMRAMMAVPLHHTEIIIKQSNRALEYLHPDNISIRTTALWALGYAHQIQGDRNAARDAHTSVISIGKRSGNVVFTIGSTTSLGELCEGDNKLNQAEEYFQRVIEMAGDPPMPIACTAYLGLARIHYEWNRLESAKRYAKQCLKLAEQLESVDVKSSYMVFLAHLKLSNSDFIGAVEILEEAEQFVRDNNFIHQLPLIVSEQVLTLLHQGKLASSAELSETYELPVSQIRVLLAQGDTSKALESLNSLIQEIELKKWKDERLKVLILLAIAHNDNDENDKALKLLNEALDIAEPNGFIRTFIDEGPRMASLLYDALSHKISPKYVQKLLASFPKETPKKSNQELTQDLDYQWVESLSDREIEVLKLVVDGMTKQEIANELFLSLNTVKAHTRTIYGKLGVNNRTQAGVRARNLGILSPS